MIRHLFRRHNRAITLVSVAALGAYFLLPNPDFARGLLIGGLLPVVYLGVMREHLARSAGGADLGRIRGRLFLLFLVRFGLLAAGLALALWLSIEAFWSAVAALAVVYVAMILSMSRELRWETGTENHSPSPGTRCDASSDALKGNDGSCQ